ncbi:amidase family protein [Alphaproteobacteria bacterium]|jgi:aspartyl-tRNA(Asn)/glutamyl-tRNA(Gln) amidotransferase subunit A|nr:amidase family protein [Alphaproteobacteria bacterium]MDC6452322.1 amidase family protein [Alphaproteobacteria bacterium]
MKTENSQSENLINKVNKILKKIQNDPASFENIFTELFEKDFNEQLDNINKVKKGKLKGLIISVKDLFDVKGYKTKGGTKFIDDKIAQKDAKCISLIRKAGGLLLGHTNMTELAYSGLGINPHYGTPLNPVFKNSVPGGSTSGGAVSIALDVADITIGTDTGGSTRIPAAFTGITGFKPTQDSISRDNVLVLSTSLDSVGLMARDVSLCKLGFETMRNKSKNNIAKNNIKIIIPKNFGFEDIDDEIKVGFDSAKEKIIKSGLDIQEIEIPLLDHYKKIPLWQFAAVECQAEYFEAYNNKKHLIDPNVSRRMDRANQVTAVEYVNLCKERTTLISQFNTFLGNNFLLLPTVSITPPLIKDCENVEFYDKMNLISLRNTTLANYMNGCSLSLPYTIKDKPVGIMLNGSTDNDDQLLEIGSKIEKLLSK